MISAIRTFAETFFWLQRSIILPAVLGIPVALEAILFVAGCFANKDLLKEKVSLLRADIKDLTTQRPSETKDDYKLRQVAKVVKLVVFAALLSGAIATPFLLMPGTLALPVALLAILTISLLWKGVNKIPGLVQDLTKWVQETCTQKLDESRVDFQMRVAKGSIKVLLATLCVAASIFAAVHGGIFIAAAISLGRARPWSIPDLLPAQTPITALIEYALVGLLHLFFAVRAYQKGERGSAVFHGINAALSFIFPIAYALQDFSKMRLHHSFTGELFQLLPFRCTKILGAIISFDSLLYFISSNRGEGKMRWGYKEINGEKEWVYGKFYNNFDFMNIVVSAVSLFFLFYVIAGFIEIAARALLSKEKAKKAIIEASKTEASSHVA